MTDSEYDGNAAQVRLISKQIAGAVQLMARYND